MQRVFEGGICLKVGRDFEDYIRAAVITRAWRLLSLLSQIWHLFEGSA